MPLGVGGELAGDQQRAPAVAAYGGQRLVRAGQGGDGDDRVVGVQLAEAVRSPGATRRRRGAGSAGGRAAGRAARSSPRRAGPRRARRPAPPGWRRTPGPCRSASCRGRSPPRAPGGGDVMRPAYGARAAPLWTPALIRPRPPDTMGRSRHHGHSCPVHLHSDPEPRRAPPPPSPPRARRPAPRVGPRRARDRGGRPRPDRPPGPGERGRRGRPDPPARHADRSGDVGGRRRPGRGCWPARTPCWPRSGSPTTTYRWTTALNGFAVGADARAGGRDRGGPRGRVGRGQHGAGHDGSPRDGAGVGPGRPAPRHGRRGRRHRRRRLRARPRLAALRRRPRPGSRPRGLPRDLRGRARTGRRRPATARSWPRGGGSPASARTGSAAPSTSRPRDAVGHGTQVASVAAGNAGVSVRMHGRTVGQFGGIAPAGPDRAPTRPAGVPPTRATTAARPPTSSSAIDRATADGVDVLNLAVAGPPGTDTVERALLGAAEADIVVVGGRRQRRPPAVRRARQPRGSPRSAPPSAASGRAGCRSSAARP